jgi:hypothetical protein
MGQLAPTGMLFSRIVRPVSKERPLSLGRAALISPGPGSPHETSLAAPAGKR